MIKIHHNPTFKILLGIPALHKSAQNIIWYSETESQTTLKKNNWIHFDRTTNDLDQVGVTIKQFGGVIEPFILANTKSIAL